MSEEILLGNNNFKIVITSNNKNKVPGMKTEKMGVEKYIKTNNNRNPNIKERWNSEISKTDSRDLKNLYYTYYNSDLNPPKLLIGILRNIINGILTKIDRWRIWGILVIIIINIIKMNFID